MNTSQLFFQKLLFTSLIITSALSTLSNLHSAEVYFAIRSDGNVGAGTKADPFDGSAIPENGFLSRFDARMHNLGSGNEINLAPGTYWTRGDDDNSGTKGYFLQSNTTLSGAGIGSTVIKLKSLGGTPQRPANIHTVVAAGTYSPTNWWEGRVVNYNNVTVKNLTVDCNAAGLGLSNIPANEGVCLYGVALAGSNCTVQNVEVIGPFGITDSNQNDANGVGFESFAISIDALTQNCSGALIDNCIVRNGIGNYISAISLLGSGTATISGVVSNNLVTEEAYSAYSGGNLVNSIFYNNIAQNTQFGFRYDTGSLLNVTLKENTFTTKQGGFLLRSSGGSQPVNSITITKNNLSASGQGTNGETASGVIQLDRAVSGLSITDNNISSSSSKPAFYTTPGFAYSGITYANNNTSLNVSNAGNAPINYLVTEPGAPTVVTEGSSPTLNSVTVADLWAKRSIDPIIRFLAPSGGTNEKHMDFQYRADLKQFFGRLISDDGLSSVIPWLTLTRTGTTPTRFDLSVLDTYIWNVLHVPNELRLDNGILKIKEGTNAIMGTATLSGGSVNVNTTAANANSRVFLTRQSSNGSSYIGLLTATPTTNSFSITSRKSGNGIEVGDYSTVAWLIITPAP